MSSITKLCCLALIFLLPGSARSESSVYSWTALYTESGKLVEKVYNFTGHLIDCNVYGDRQISADALKMIPRENQFLVNEENFQEMVQSCSVVDLAEIKHLRKKRQIIFPNTKWCGVGDIAAHKNDLGSNRRLDKCCRTHDRCPLFINVGETKYGLTNYNSYAISDCSCDIVFRDCLRATNQVAASLVGNIYFGLVGLDCLKMAHPEICTGWWLSRTCKPDRSQPKRLSIVPNFITY